MTGELQGKTAIISGAASGIGRASAFRFAVAGANLVLLDRAREVEAVAAQIGARAYAIQADASSEPHILGAVEEACDRFGGLDVFFANAGISSGARGGIFDATPEMWLDLLRVNLIGPFLAVKHAAPKIVERGGGAIICTASVGGLRSGAGPAHYSASKAGVISLVQTAAQQLAGTNVRVNAICPGLIETGMTASTYEAARAAGKEHRIGQLNPLRRGGRAEEIAEAALFLASDASGYVNGHALVVDGGLSSSHPFAGRPPEPVRPA